MAEKIRAVDLFAGCGGLTLGFEKAGFSVVGAFEFWDNAIDVYKKNFNHPVYKQDLSNVSESVEAISKLNVDVIIGGPPCQDFSHAGKRIEAQRASLTESFSQIVVQVKPKAFLMENVDRAIKSKAFAHATAIFRQAGYGLTIRVLDASFCGCPQKRKRMFCIGVLGEEDDALGSLLDEFQSKKPMTMRDYFGKSLGIDYYYRHPRNYERRAIFSMDEPAPTMRGVNRPVPKGYPGHPKDACTLKNAKNLRALTTKERAQIQTFPADFHWPSTKTDAEQMIGNAVPVNLAKFVGIALKKYLQDKLNKQKTVQSRTKEEMLLSDDLLVQFKTYLKGKNLTIRTVSDIVSRTKVARALIGELKIPFDAEHLIVDLERVPEFKRKGVSVRSQIRRSVRLLGEFLDSKS